MPTKPKINHTDFRFLLFFYYLFDSYSTPFFISSIHFFPSFNNTRLINRNTFIQRKRKLKSHSVKSSFWIAIVYIPIVLFFLCCIKMISIQQRKMKRVNLFERVKWYSLNYTMFYFWIEELLVLFWAHSKDRQEQTNFPNDSVH